MIMLDINNNEKDAENDVEKKVDEIITIEYKIIIG